MNTFTHSLTSRAVFGDGEGAGRDPCAPLPRMPRTHHPCASWASSCTAACCCLLPLHSSACQLHGAGHGCGAARREDPSPCPPLCPCTPVPSLRTRLPVPLCSHLFLVFLSHPCKLLPQSV